MRHPLSGPVRDKEKWNPRRHFVELGVTPACGGTSALAAYETVEATPVRLISTLRATPVGYDVLNSFKYLGRIG
ncbi:hypothetical protein AWC15_21530 [Mycobacterium lacus]|uniref:Uncharacterized protein n=1 Tax=Mycobacterium lacus TaxID=169765 RepID=A0A1X1Y6K5_9MYCO|nr:hypothetical protein AWC15_21530 [Mycobacterium lacus]BBX96386.1 hypothetical protein MLAC_16800 [Mycobacterium lacus]